MSDAIVESTHYRLSYGRADVFPGSQACEVTKVTKLYYNGTNEIRYVSWGLQFLK